MTPLRQRDRSETQRRWLAEEAARLMAEQGITEPERARRKVAERAGIDNKRLWPSNEETAALNRRREQALMAMRHFHLFRPRLIGDLAADYPDPGQPIRLQLFAETPDEVIYVLMNQGIRWQERQEQRRFADGSRRLLPVLTFLAGETAVELLVLPPGARSNPPLNPMDERPERGLDEAALGRLLE